MEINKLKHRSEVRARLPQSESLPEWELHHGLLRHGFRGQKQYPIQGFFADIAFPEFMLAIEYDGAEFHQDFQRDVTREIAIKNAGWEILRVGRVGGKEYEITLIGKEISTLGWYARSDHAIEGAIEIARKILLRKMPGKMILDYVTNANDFRELLPISAKQKTLGKPKAGNNK